MKNSTFFPIKRRNRSSISAGDKSRMSQGMVGSTCYVKDDIYCRASVWVWRVVPIVLTVLGIIGNVFSIIILLRKNLRSKPCFILVFLAISDLAVTVSVFLLDGLRLGFDVYLPKGICLLPHFVKYAFSGFSLWTVAIFTVERLSFVLLPHLSNTHLTRAKTEVALFVNLIMVTTIFGVIIFSPSTIENELQTNGTIVDNLTRSNLATIKFPFNENLRKKIFAADERLQNANSNEQNQALSITNFLSDTEFESINTTTGDNLHFTTNRPAQIADDDATLDLTTSGNLTTNGEVDTHTSVNMKNDTETESQKKLSHDGTMNDFRDFIASMLPPLIQNTFLASNNNRSMAQSTETRNDLTDQPADSLPIKQEGDCWEYTFKKGSYQQYLRGAAIVLIILIPFTIIILGNLGLVYSLKNRQQNSNSADSQTATLFAISCMLMITIIPYSVIVALNIVFRDKVDLTSSYMRLIASIAECFTMCNFALNFYCYFWKSSLFKTECKAFWRDLRSALRR